jgi:hypothetical protein
MTFGDLYIVRRNEQPQSFTTDITDKDAKVHLSILNQELARMRNSSLLESTKVLLEDTTSALNSGDVNKALVHLNLIKQQFALLSHLLAWLYFLVPLK